MRKRIFALLLAAMMVFSCVAFASAEEGISTDREPIVITWGTPSLSWGEGRYTEQYPFLQYVYEKFGIEFEFISMDAEKMQLLAATGELPDITYMFDTLYPELIQSGQLLELSDLIDKYAPDYKRIVGEKALKIYGDTYGGQYGMPILIRNFLLEDTPNASNNGATVRVDLWVEKGAPEFKTEEEFIDFLKELQTEKRAESGDNSIYGISTAMNIPIWASYYGVKDIFWYGHEVDVTTGEIRNAYTNPDSAYWQALHFLNKAWNADIMDPECFTQSWQDMWDKLQTGKAFMGFWSGMQTQTEIAGETSYLGYTCGPFPYIPYIYNDFSPLGNGVNGMRCISSACKYPERVMEFLNWLDTPDGVRIACNGVLGVDWEYDESGAPVMIGEMLAAYERGEGSNYRANRNFQRNAYNFITSSDQICEDGYPAYITSTVQWRIDHATPGMKNFAQFFGDEYSFPGQIYMKWHKEGKVKTIDTPKASYMVGLMTTPTDETVQAIGSCEMVLAQRVADIVMSKDFEAIQGEIIEQMNELGYAEADAEIQGIYENALARYTELFGE